jgi:putative oxidoreductase
VQKNRDNSHPYATIGIDYLIRSLKMKITQDIATLVLRIGFGVGMVTHGIGKITHFSAIAPNFPAYFGLSSEINLALVVFAELICAGAIAMGLFTRISSIPIIFTMSVAFFVAHAGDPFQRKELAFLYLIGFIGIFLLGSGKYSLTSVIPLPKKEGIVGFLTEKNA